MEEFFVWARTLPWFGKIGVWVAIMTCVWVPLFVLDAITRRD